MISACIRSLAVVAITLAAGCASVDDKTATTEPKPQREYRTGSNIPVRESKPASDEERARAAEQARQTQQAGTPAAKP